MINYSQTQLILFVYDNYLTGHWDYLKKSIHLNSYIPGIVHGREYEIRVGMPILEVPECDVLSVGSGKIRNDLELQSDLMNNPGKVFGEPLSFKNDMDLEWNSFNFSSLIIAP